MPHRRIVMVRMRVAVRRTMLGAKDVATMIVLSFFMGALVRELRKALS